MRVLLMKSFLTAVAVAGLAGCAQTPRTSAVGGGGASSVQTAKTAPDLMPGEQVDYAGHRCGNPNLHVKTHLCLFPRR